MNCIINGVCDLFAAPTQCAAITLAAVAFVAGVLGTMDIPQLPVISEVTPCASLLSGS